MKLNGSEILVKVLLEQGVDTVFGYPGGQIIHVYDSLYKYSSEIKQEIKEELHLIAKDKNEAEIHIFKNFY